MDFYDIKSRTLKKGHIEVYPEFYVGMSKDIMIRGKTFYAIWNEAKNLWSTNEYDVARIVDNDLKEYKKKISEGTDDTISLLTLSNYSSGKWNEYCNFVKHSPDNFTPLDNKLIFSNTKVKREDYASKTLPYPLEKGDYSAWDELVGTLYEKEERDKIEWAIGAIVAGDAKDIQKFEVFYGEAGSGKSTILHIIEKLFEGYYTTFEAKALGSSNNAFATEVFKTNPLVAIQHDGDLSRIEDNSKLNSIISHEDMVLNEKYKAAYTSRINCFLFMATNKPVKITDAKSGIIRRLIDIHPSNKKIPRRKYDELYSRIDFELGAIAYHCLEVYKDLGKHYYDAYRPLDMMYKTDAFYNFVEDSYDLFKEQNAVSLKQAWDMYKRYCDDALVEHKLVMYKFREELKNYFASYKDFARIGDKQFRKYYSGFLTNKFEDSEKIKPLPINTWLKFTENTSLFDEVGANWPAQEANDEEKPSLPWDKVKTRLCDINVYKTHYVRVPENHIVIDFDIKDENGAKSYEKNLEAASNFPPTYAELSKSGAGIHLHYIYDGDVNKLEQLYDKDIEIKVFKGKSSLRRKLTKCNSIDIATINSGLPLKGDEPKVIDEKSIKSAAGLRELIKRHLKKEIVPSTSQSVSLIKDILDQTYASGLTYDVSDMYHDIYSFASQSTNNAPGCIKMVLKMHFKSKDVEESNVEHDLQFSPNAKLCFFDVEVFPNLFVIVYKILGQNPVRMINPSPQDVHNFIWDENGKLRHKLIGFNNRKYDNHIIYARSLGDSLYDLYLRSQGIVSGDYNAFINEAYDISYTDIYDYSSKKQSLKKWEIELKIHHLENNIPWDKPVDPIMWDKVAEYCENDVEATEAVFFATQEDFECREILAEWSGLTVNDTTNDHTMQIIFGDDRNPQSQFNYRFMGDIPKDILVLDTETFEFHEEHNRTAEELISEGKFSVFDMNMNPVFPGYTFNKYAKVDKSMYRGISVGEGGYVYGEPGMYIWILLDDIASMHPSSIIAEKLFGKYTQRFKDIRDLRLYIKHKEYDKARSMFDGIFAKYLKDDSKAKALSTALKIPINSVYGLTSAKFKNRCRDPRNEDNIVAKRGALFMVNLKFEVEKRGFTVAHIKTDSIKIPNATKAITEFVEKYGKVYGYNFEVEDTYERLCLVNNAVYIAKYSEPHKDKKTGKDIWWTATGAQFQHPYVFKTLFSKEPIEFDDLCETKSVTTSMYLDNNEGMAEGEHNYIFIGRAGQYCPVKPGTGGGILLREKDGKYNAVTGTTGYRWKESETLRNTNYESEIDYGYFTKLSDTAVTDISKYGDFDWFVSDEPTPKKVLLDIQSDELPF